MPLESGCSDRARLKADVLEFQDSQANFIISRSKIGDRYYPKSASTADGVIEL